MKEIQKADVQHFTFILEQHLFLNAWGSVYGSDMQDSLHDFQT